MHDYVGKKKGHPEIDLMDLTDDGSGAQSFTLHPLFIEKDFFKGFPLAVSNGECAVIRQLDEEGRRKHQASSMVSLMKVTEMVVSLAGEGANSSTMVRKMESKKVALQEKAQIMKSTLERGEE